MDSIPQILFNVGLLEYKKDKYFSRKFERQIFQLNILWDVKPHVLKSLLSLYYLQRNSCFNHFNKQTFFLLHSFKLIISLTCKMGFLKDVIVSRSNRSTVLVCKNLNCKKWKKKKVNLFSEVTQERKNK